jgi:antitoxin YefM
MHLVMSETMPLAKVKAHLSEVVDRVIASHERVNITRHGRREAVVIAADELDAEARVAAARGEGLDLAEVRRSYPLLGRRSR